MKFKLPDFVTVVLVLAAGWLALGGWVPDFISPSSPPTAATYTFEKDMGGPPGPVLAAMSVLNSKGILATNDEVDATDGDDQVPDQYKVSRPAAVAAGLPALVVMGGDKVLKVVKAPKTEQEVFEAAGLLSSFDERHKRFMERGAAQ